MRIGGWILVSSAVACWAACVGDDPAPGIDGATDGGTTSSGDVQQGGSSGAPSGSSSGEHEAGTCAGVFCESFEGEPALDGWKATALNANVLVVDGHASQKAVGIRHAVTQEVDAGHFEASIDRAIDVPAGRYLRLDLWFWAGTCDHTMHEMVQLYLSGYPVQLRRFAGSMDVRTFEPGVGDAASTERRLAFPAAPDNTWTPFWVEIDRTDGTYTASVGAAELPGTTKTTVTPGSELAIKPALFLGADSTLGGCEVRYDDIRLSVRD